MKRSLTILALAFLITQVAEAQNNVLYIRLGPSQFTGIAGLEMQFGHLAFEGGYGWFDLPQFEEPWEMAGVGVSYYTGKPFNNSFYCTAGYSFNGATKITVVDSDQYRTEYADSIGLIAGYKWGGSGWFSLKGGLGYQFSEIGNSITGELTIGIAFLSF